MSVSVRIPSTLLHNEAFDLHIFNLLKQGGIPAVKMNHMTPVIEAKGELTSEIDGEDLIYSWTPEESPVEAPTTLEIKEAEAHQE